MSDAIRTLVAGLKPTPHYEPPDALHFGDVVAEAAAALGDTIVVPLVHLGYIRAAGADSESFLQGQFSNDLRRLTLQRAQLSSLNSAKGRMLATLHLFRRDEGVHLEIHRSVLDAVRSRLSMYVLRAKVSLSDESALLGALGLAGERSTELLQAAGLPVPAAPMDCATEGRTTVIRRQGRVPRFTVHAPSATVRSLWDQWAGRVRPAGTNAWKLLEIRAGVPTVYAETQDRFVPQMANLDRLDGISFDKGCYTGQEIVARLHYLGAAKRRMFGARIETCCAEPGTPVYDPGATGQSVGDVVDAAVSPAGGEELLVVLQTDHAASADLRLNEPDGPLLRLTE